VEQFLIILGIIWLAVISPGADFAMISQISSIQGRRAGILAAMGIAIGCWLHVTYAIFGLALVERLFPQALSIIRVAGAIYLIYLGIKMMLAKTKPAIADAPACEGNETRAFITGLLTNSLNPKTSVFVVSLYAQGIGRETSIFVQLGYGAAISLSHLIWFGLVAVFLSQSAIRAYVLANQRAVNIVIGCMLILLGIALALSDIG
jgi:threonine/homoserine/homoserine lactone efflux protein